MFVSANASLLVVLVESGSRLYLQLKLLAASG